MSTHPEMTNDAVTASGQRENMAWLLQQFTDQVPGVSHAVLLSRDGLRLLDSGVDKDWADELSAALSGVASLAANITGPSHKKSPARQVLIERDDCLLFVQGAGRSAAFENHPGSERGEVDTILAVVATADVDAGTAGYEMGRLVGRFAPYMQIPVRVATHDAAR